MSARPNLRTLTIRAAVKRTGLPADRLRRAIHDGELAAFREPPKPGKAARTTFFVLESSLESWFLARVKPVTAPPLAADADTDPVADEAADVDDELLKTIPASQRIFS